MILYLITIIFEIYYFKQTKNKIKKVNYKIKTKNIKKKLLNKNNNLEMEITLDEL